MRSQITKNKCHFVTRQKLQPNALTYGSPWTLKLSVPMQAYESPTSTQRPTHVLNALPGDHHLPHFGRGRLWRLVLVGAEEEIHRKGNGPLWGRSNPKSGAQRAWGTIPGRHCCHWGGGTEGTRWRRQGGENELFWTLSVGGDAWDRPCTVGPHVPIGAFGCSSLDCLSSMGWGRRKMDFQKKRDAKNHKKRAQINTRNASCV